MEHWYVLYCYDVAVATLRLCGMAILVVTAYLYFLDPPSRHDRLVQLAGIGASFFAIAWCVDWIL